ncbi:Binding-protein-dependent transport systems inner membrane component [Thermobacillus xylanilyticus]|jgi:putative aldouronate transport system permease protein|uniref:ABC-type sugar transport system, permease component n=2 Tax=Thermobacillus TaxID=76632 RepID=L0EAF7_THECK|nr:MULTISPECIES: carbohydrate ABC transporter permease [Thermobacillus]AGA56629.1 ABC-type sugar transport system, permease component [Thermobacillus composti KWC4]REJ12618.1 MAG: carbohydrate ABC transporter permease [Paenibacillaceae bacterium]CAG5080157.1 Binding-protein-dependent transport systems inner membrane component [Thermobacillus xylanilyticus]
MRTNAVQQTLFHAIMAALSAACLFPFILLFVVSFSDEQSIILNGYSLIPDSFSLEAYRYLWGQLTPLARAYGITVLITAVGTITGLLISSLLAYSLSRDEMPLRRVLSFLVVFTLLFNGGLVPTYLVYTEVFHLKNTLLALIVPGLLTNAFFILIIRTFFKMSIPGAVIESAYIDGASEWTIFSRIILPLSLPILATIGMMLTIAYWNDWFNGLIYITNPKLYSIQNLLNRMLSNIQFLMQNDLGGRSSESLAQMPMNAVRMAMAVIGILPILCIYPFFQKYLVKGLVIGAVKG